MLWGALLLLFSAAWLTHATGGWGFNASLHVARGWGAPLAIHPCPELPALAEPIHLAETRPAAAPELGTLAALAGLTVGAGRLGIATLAPRHRPARAPLRKEVPR